MCSSDLGKSPALDHSKLPQTFAQGCALGFNPLTKDGGEGSLLAAGGIGMLVDRAGNDRYEGGYCSQGVANYRGVGLLYDVNGTDNYSAGSLSQGTGVFHGFGFLVDGAGADTYNTNGSNAQGCGYDGGLGLLLEVEGKDVYNAIDSAQAVSAHSGAGILIDLAGNDSYKAKSRCHAAIGDTGEHWEDDWPSVAILLDFGADRNVFAGSGRADKANHADKMLLFYCTAKSIGDALKARMGFE